MITIDSVLFHFDVDSLGSELIDSLTFSHEHDLELVSFGIVVDVLGQFLVNHVIFDWYVNSDSLLQLNDVLFEHLDLGFSIL